MTQARVGVIGYGIVGEATARLFDQPAIYDPPKGYDDPKVLMDCDVIFMAVPVPTVLGKNDLSIVHEVLGTIIPILRQEQIIAMRSTVLPGTVRSLQEQYPGVRFASNPEFLRAHRALDDARFPYRMVIGADTPGVAERVADVYRTVLDPDVPFVLTDTRTAEMIKYAANNFLALKIAYMHQVWDACRVLGIDYDQVKRGLELDPRIGDGDTNEELTVRPDQLGFDDECLPKDLAAYIGFLQDELGLPTTLYDATETVNAGMLARRLAAS